MDSPDSRVAWMISAVTHGTLMSVIVPDGNYDCIDPPRLFCKNFPPVFFIHGTADNIVPARFSEKAHKDLVDMGVVTEIRLVEGHDHGFDIDLQKEEESFRVIREGLEFLARYAHAGS
jgi:acetyl esterase/lipase